MIKEFINITGSEGIIKTFGESYNKDKFGNYDFYEIMELAEFDWSKEIRHRSKNGLYYEEKELIVIMKQIVKTLALLQKNHITHRDIKPQNIMILNRKFKLCDFGNARKIKKEGYVLQKIRGSEMYLSPILFKGFHSEIRQVKHNTYKSDVFSLGMCFLLATSLSYGPLNSIREIYDMEKIGKVIKQGLGNRYSQRIFTLLYKMLQIDENLRPDFIELEGFFPEQNI